MTEMVQAVSSCVHFVTETAHIGVCGATACILGCRIFLRIMQQLFLPHSWPSGVSNHYEYYSLLCHSLIFACGFCGQQRQQTKLLDSVKARKLA